MSVENTVFRAGDVENVCYSGAAYGADTAFGIAAHKANHAVFHLSFDGHSVAEGTVGRVVTLSAQQLREADVALKAVAKTIHRSFPTRKAYVNNLLRRNFYQVNNAERVYAIADVDDDGFVVGGTGWAVELAIQFGIDEIYAFDQTRQHWLTLANGSKHRWEAITGVPVFPYGHYAGIGSRDLTDGGKAAIQDLYTL